MVSAEVVSRLKVDPNVGLDPEEVGVRLTQYGPNRLTRPKKWTRVRRLVDQFNDVLIWLLIAAAAISGFVLDAWIDAAAITAIVVLNAVIGYAQEARADRALVSLRNLEAPMASVIRNGEFDEVDARDLVPGDILVIEAGDRVPADARVLDSVRLVANEAPLTGESLPVAKDAEPTEPDTLVADRTSMLFAGTTVVSGRGRAVVALTAAETEMGRIAALFTDDQPMTPLQIELDKVGRRLALIAVVAAVLIFGAGMARSFPIETMALTAVALAVAAIPEGLPAVVTVSLAGGLQRMAHRHAIVRRLPAVETLGAVDVICTDKTGTLTAPELKVATVVMADGRNGDHLLDERDPAMTALIDTAALCNDAFETVDGWGGDPTEIALLSALRHAGLDYDLIRTGMPRLDEAGFDGRRKRMSTIHVSGSGYRILVKGAPEVLLELSSRYLTSFGADPLDEKGRLALATEAERVAASGMRTLGFAFRELDERPENPVVEEKDLCFIGLVGLNERIRDEVPDAIETALAAGVTTVMVTGDHATTAAAVADSIGLIEGAVMAGADLSAISTETLQENIRDYKVFARVDPADKVKIIQAWQRTGATVAMTGDGVNDAPALHRADIGVAMGSGTDVARESAAMVLADDNYATIVSAIAEGRRLFANLRNVVHYLLSANASEVIYVLIGFLVFGYLGEPLLAIQLLWINLMSDALPAIALGMDTPSRDLMSDRPGRGRDILSGRNVVLLIAQGTILAAAAIVAMIAGSYSLDLDYETVRTMVFTTLVFSQLLHALSVRAGEGPLTKPSLLMVLSIVGSATLQMGVVYTAFGNEVFHTTPLDFPALAWAIGASAASMATVRLLNLRAYRLREDEK
jgi:Ca2+-transporting ATPase